MSDWETQRNNWFANAGFKYFIKHDYRENYHNLMHEAVNHQDIIILNGEYVNVNLMHMFMYELIYIKDIILIKDITMYNLAIEAIKLGGDIFFKANPNDLSPVELYFMYLDNTGLELYNAMTISIMFDEVDRKLGISDFIDRITYKGRTLCYDYYSMLQDSDSPVLEMFLNIIKKYPDDICNVIDAYEYDCNNKRFSYFDYPASINLSRTYNTEHGHKAIFYTKSIQRAIPQLDRINRAQRDCNNKRFKVININMFMRTYVNSSTNFFTNSHSNILLYDRFHNTVERFEPHGTKSPFECGSSIDESIMKWLDMKENHGIKYISPAELYNNCMISTRGVQKHGDNGCLSWCYIYLNLRIQFPDVSRGVIIKCIQKITRQQLYNYGCFVLSQQHDLNFLMN
jgi:hypothetical protein